MCGAKFLQHCMPLFKKQRVLRLDDQLFVENCKLMHKLVDKILPTPIINLFEQNTGHYQTRSAHVAVVKHTSLMVNKSFLCKPIVQWQRVKSDLKNMTRTQSFAR